MSTAERVNYPFLAQGGSICFAHFGNPPVLSLQLNMEIIVHGKQTVVAHLTAQTKSTEDSNLLGDLLAAMFCGTLGAGSDTPNHKSQDHFELKRQGELNTLLSACVMKCVV